MSQIIKIKQSATPGKIPLLSDLQLGELAINTHDGKLYTKQDNGVPSIIEITGGSGGPTNEYQIAFSFASGASVPLVLAPAFKAALSIELAILVPFDDNTATLSVGDQIDNDSLVPVTDNDPTISTAYIYAPLVAYSVATPVYLYITPGASTQGTGVLTIRFQR